MGAWLHTLIILSYTVTKGKCKVTLVHSQKNIGSQVRQAKPVVMESCSDVMELECSMISTSCFFALYAGKSFCMLFGFHRSLGIPFQPS